MYSEEFNGMSAAAAAKNNLFTKNKVGFYLSSLLAGIFIAFGVVASNMVGASVVGQPYAKLVTGATFVAALSIVVMAGSELFTGNTMVLSAGVLCRTVSIKDAAGLLAVCYLGNLTGSVLLALLFWGAQIPQGAVGEYFVSVSAAKMALPLIPLFIRSILCNMLVCLAVWCTFRCKSESGKLIMIFWCISSFVIAGFEHSVANMSLLTIGMLVNQGGAALSWGGYIYNLLVVTLGNMVGAFLFITFPYYIISKEK